MFSGEYTQAIKSHSQNRGEKEMSLDVYVHPLDDDEDVPQWLDEDDEEE